jgi:zinc protease
MARSAALLFSWTFILTVASGTRAAEPPTTAPAIRLFEAEPKPGPVVESSVCEDLQITSAYLANGVRVHHRQMDQWKGRVTIAISVAGGQIEETAANAGITRAASLIFHYPATSSLPSAVLRPIIADRRVNFTGRMDRDALVFLLAGAPRDIEVSLALAYAVLTDPVLEQNALDRWRDKQHEEIERARKTPQFCANQALWQVVAGDDPRAPFPVKEQIDRQTLEHAQAWLRRLCRQAPVEVAVVGDMSWDDVRPLLEKYLGSLPDRPRAAEHLDPLRRLHCPRGPLREERTYDGQDAHALAVHGFRAADERDVADTRVLELAAHILRARVIDRLRTQNNLASGVGVAHQPARAYRGAGLLYAAAPCLPDVASRVVAEMEAAFRALREQGPTPEELSAAQAAVVRDSETRGRSPFYWRDKLESLDRRQARLDDLKADAKAYKGITAAQVRSALEKYYQPARSFRIIVRTSDVPAPPE